MIQDRLNFRAWNKVTLTDDEDNDYEKSFMLYNVDPFKGYIAGINKEDFEDQLKKQGFSEDEIEQIEQNYSRSCDDYLNLDVDEIDQCTGLKDKNRELVFEGDVVYHLRYDAPYSNKRKSKNIRCVVKWDDSRLCYYFDNIEKEQVFICFKFGESKEIEVIGNIHENPELLK